MAVRGAWCAARGVRVQCISSSLHSSSTPPALCGGKKPLAPGACELTELTSSEAKETPIASIETPIEASSVKEAAAAALPGSIEHLGLQSRLVVTPLVEGLYSSRVSAVHAVLGHPAGQPDVTHASGGYRATATSFMVMDLAATGACVDELSSTELEGLSAVAQHMSTIWRAVAAMGCGEGEGSHDLPLMMACKRARARYPTHDPGAHGACC